MARVNMPLTLDKLALKQWSRVAAQGAANPRLSALGFLPHAPVRVLRRSWWRQGPMVVQLGNTTFALRPQEAQQIALEPVA